MHAQWWTHVIAKVTRKLSDFITLLCCCGWQRGKLQISRPWIISRFLCLQLLCLMFAFFQINACMYFLYKSLPICCIQAVFNVCICVCVCGVAVTSKPVPCNVQSFHIYFSFYLIFFLANFYLPLVHNNCRISLPRCLPHVLSHLSLWLI